MKDFIFVSSRVRFARNLEGVRFPAKASEEEAESVLGSVLPALEKRGYRVFRTAKMQENLRRVLIEQNLASPALCASPYGALGVSEDESRAVMVMEEDELRLTATGKGLSVRRLYDELSKEEVALSSDLKFAFDKKLGYLTACATNLGTGMRASVMLFLPALTRAGAIGELKKELASAGVLVRGILGEGTESENSLYQISNARSFGVTEEEILSLVEKAALNVRDLERAARKAENEDHPYENEDRFKRAEAVLRSAVLLGYEEFTALLSDVKEGIAAGVLQNRGIDPDDLMISMRPAHIEAMARQPLKTEEENFFRAEYVRKILR